MISDIDHNKTYLLEAVLGIRPRKPKHEEGPCQYNSAIRSFILYRNKPHRVFNCGINTLRQLKIELIHQINRNKMGKFGDVYRP